tara:strand:+ start:1267 stop:2484 length:1218 start_codon:yes stop_codon:yes gene_type:complete
MEGSSETPETPLIGTNSTPKFYERGNLLVGVLFIVLALFFLVNGIIMKIPHKTPFDKKEVHTEKELETKDAYTYEHEKGGDRKLRLTVVYVLYSMASNCLTLAILFIIGTNKDLTFKNKGFTIAIGIFGAILIGCFIYYIVYKTGVLNKKENEKFKEYELEKTCLTDGEGIIYDNCAIDDIVELYNTCIEPTRTRFRTKCATNLILYQNVRKALIAENERRESNDESPEIKPTDDMLKAESLSRATFNKYNDMDTNPEQPLTCERVINTQVENNPQDQRCKENAMNNFKITDKHKECIEKSKKQCKLDKNNLYDKETQEGTTYSNCTEKKKYNELKFKPVQEIIDDGVEKAKLEHIKNNPPKFTESGSETRRTQSSTDTSGSGATVGGSIDGVDLGGNSGIPGIN